MKILFCVVLLLLSSCALERTRLINSGVVVTIVGIGHGSGIVVELNNEKFVLTAEHLFQNAGNATVTISWVELNRVSGENPFGYVKTPVEIVIKDDNADLALLRPLSRLPTRLSVLKVAHDSTNLRPGTRITVVAAPGVAPSMITEGVFVTRFIDFSTGIPFILVSAEISGGSSGGGVIYKGKLVGIVVSSDYSFNRVINTPYQTGVRARVDFLTLAVPLDVVLEFLSKAEKTLRGDQ